jgi:hypothetical protein
MLRSKRLGIKAEAFAVIGRVLVIPMFAVLFSAALFAQQVPDTDAGKVFDVPTEHLEVLQGIPIVESPQFFPYVTSSGLSTTVSPLYRPDVADPAAIYANANQPGYSGVVLPHGGQSGGVTRLVADDLTFGGTAPHNVGFLIWVVCNTNPQTVTVRSMIRFYADNNGSPGALIVGYNFPAFVPLVNNICQPISVRLPPSLQFTAGNKMWAGLTFDRGEGASATEAQMNNIGSGYFNPPEVGSSADLFFRTTSAGDFFSSNPPGSVMTIAGNPIDNFGWEIRRRVRLNPAVRLDSNPRPPSGTARWTVTLNTSDPADATRLSGLAPNNFGLVTTGNVTGTIASVVATGTGGNSWTVTVNLGAGSSGTVGLNFTDNQVLNLSTGVANALPLVGEVYNVIAGATPTPTPPPTPLPSPTPTPSSHTASGRVTSPTGQGLRSIAVVLTDSQGVQTRASTSSFGLYSFTGLATGNYTITATSKRYRFAPRVVLINQNNSTLDFNGLE